MAQAPNARFLPAPADGVLPDGFFSTTNLPTYLKVDGAWKMPREPRMDAALVRERFSKDLCELHSASERTSQGIVCVNPCESVVPRLSYCGILRS